MKSQTIGTALFAAVMMTMGCVGTIEDSTPGPAGDNGNLPPDAAGTPPPSQQPPPGGNPDANVSSPPDAAPDNFLTCREAATPPVPRILHNAGENCMMCHGEGGIAPRWYAAGTAYQDGAGRQAAAGVNITIKDATGKIVNIVTASNGNFWTPEPLQYPLYTFISSCPDIQSMGVEVPAARAGSCNSCHNGNELPRINL